MESTMFARSHRYFATASALAAMVLTACTTTPPFPPSMLGDAQLSCAQLQVEMARLQALRKIALEKIAPSAAMATPESSLFTMATPNPNADATGTIYAADARIRHIKYVLGEKKCVAP
jgi:hypothetical protein